MELNARQLILLFSERHRDALGQRYVPTWGRDGKLFRDLKEELSDAELREAIEVFFSKDRKSYTVPWFRAIINQILLEMKPENIPKTMYNPDVKRFL